MKASHLSFTKTVPLAIASELRVHSSVFNRLGEMCVVSKTVFYLNGASGTSYVSWSLEELLLECYFEYSSTEDMLHAMCQRSCAVR